MSSEKMMDAVIVSIQTVDVRFRTYGFNIDQVKLLQLIFIHMIILHVIAIAADC
jgi:hypothetical protein